MNAGEWAIAADPLVSVLDQGSMDGDSCMEAEREGKVLGTVD